MTTHIGEWNVLSLFSGIGGLELGLERAGMTVVGQVEIDEFCRRVLAKHWPEVPKHDDVRTCVEWWRSQPRPRVDLVCGGFPCQPVSVAGAGLAQEDKRWLWPAMAGVIRALRPDWVLLENVPGLLGRGFCDVVADLAACGYDAEWDCLPAAAVGAPHLRDRVFAVAYPTGTNWSSPSGGGPESARRVQPQRLGSEVADSPCVGRRQRWPGGSAGHGSNGTGFPPQELAQPNSERRDGRSRIFRSGRWGEPANSGWWATEPDVGRSLDGFSSWLDGAGRLAESHKLVLAYANASGFTTAETMRVLRDSHGTTDDWGEVGGRSGVSASTVLLAYLRELTSFCEAWNLDVEGAETQETSVRSMRLEKVTPCAPREWRPHRRAAGELPDPLHALSQLLARAAGQAWAAYRRSDAGSTGWGWEDGIDRVAARVPARVDRLRALGNAVVPQVSEHIGRLITSIVAGCEAT